jgi:predicted alpha/beta-hydrolase family hydrolase
MTLTDSRLDRRTIETSQGTAGLLVSRARRPIATLVLGHGAGGGVSAVDLRALASNLPEHGITVIRAEQPWVLAGRRAAPAPHLLDQVFVQLVRGLRYRTPIIVGGRSAGARVAARTGAELGAVGCLALAFPLHPPGRPDKTRLDELLTAGIPTHVIQGERDPFGVPAEFPAEVEVTAIPQADHGFSVRKNGSVSQAEVLDWLVRAALAWVTATVR